MTWGIKNDKGTRHHYVKESHYKRNYKDDLAVMKVKNLTEASTS
jgi:hypothetical protein